MCSVVERSKKIIYRYICKRYFIFSLILFLIIIIMIIGEMLVQYLYKKNKNLNSTFNTTQYLLYQISNVSNDISFNNDNLIYLNILKKPLFYCDHLSKDSVLYNYFVSSSYDTLNKIFLKYASIDPYEIHQLIQQYPILKHLTIGQKLFWLVISDKKLKYLIWNVSDQELRIYNNIHSIFTESIIRILDKSNNDLFYTILFIGEINDTFINSARALGLEEKCVLDIVNAFRYHLDFQKLHQGDRFSVLVSFIIDNNGNSFKTKLVGARLHTSGKDYYIFRANNGKFYNQEAIGSEGNFIHFPILKPYRISSNFNLNRLNPVTGHISPHSGVDFAVPVGTPVLAVGDGEIIISKYSKNAGNYVVIKHNRHCITRYMHLKKLLVKSGQKVKRGDNIALSGNTGRSTGPHLHFELWIDHHPVNPLTTKILNIEKLLGNERIKYLNQIHKIIPKLNFD